MILSSSSTSIELATFAIQHGFRDIIALDLPEDIWIQRYKFASSGTKMDIEEPDCQISLFEVAAVKLLGRITWLSSTHLWVETPLPAPMGATLRIAGKFATALGSRVINVIVEERYQTNLFHRYSQGLKCRFAAVNVAMPFKERINTILSQRAQKPPVKAYLAIRSGALRRDLINRLSKKGISIHHALNMNSLVNEPKIIHPQILFFESSLLSGLGDNLEKMSATLDLNTEVIIFGPPPISRPAFGIMAKARYGSSAADFSFDDLATRLYPLAAMAAPEDGYHIGSEHDFSIADIMLPARMSWLHPLSIKFALPLPIASYSLVTAETPLLKQTIGENFALKVTQSYKDPSPESGEFPHIIEGTLSGIASPQRRAIGDLMVNIAANKLLMTP